ncbi:MAG: DMT family transporter, partial [Gammaproteobacteria bacterium]|nr:DMT family transporter [Gammaproteobacteria bacterium]
VQLLGVACGFLGVITMVAQGSWQVFSTLSFNPADTTALLAVAGLALYTIFLRRLPIELNPLESLVGITVAGCLVTLPVYLLETLIFKPMPLTTTALWAIVVMALFGSLAGNLMWNMGNQALGPNRASIMTNLIPVFGILMAITLLGEQLRAYHAAGFIMISISVWLVLADGFRFRAESAP